MAGGAVVFNLSQVFGALAVFLRVGSFVAFMPFIGSPQTPNLVKVGLVMAATAAVYGVMGGTAVAPPPTVLGLALAVAREIILGAAMGLSLKLLLAGAQLGGQISGLQMGFAITNIIDPATGAQFSIMAHWVNFLALWIFLSIDAHYWVIQAMVESFHWVPPYQFMAVAPASHWLMDVALNMFKLAVQIGAPIIATLLLTNLVLGVLARTVPQVNVYLLSFPLTIGLGLLALGLSMPLWSHQLASVLHGGGEELLQALRTFLAR
jgi:flagellar biosynthetic protein FliR